MLLTLVCICQDHPRLKKFQAKAFPLYHECEKVYEGELFIQLLVQIAFCQTTAAVQLSYRQLFLNYQHVFLKLCSCVTVLQIALQTCKLNVLFINHLSSCFANCVLNSQLGFSRASYSLNLLFINHISSCFANCVLNSQLGFSRASFSLNLFIQNCSIPFSWQLQLMIFGLCLCICARNLHVGKWAERKIHTFSYSMCFYCHYLIVNSCFH